MTECGTGSAALIALVNRVKASGPSIISTFMPSFEYTRLAENVDRGQSDILSPSNGPNLEPTAVSRFRRDFLRAAR